MRIPLATAGLLLACGAASASGGLDCSADDAKVAFSLHGGVTRGMGGPLFQFAGEVEVKDASIVADLRRTAFELKHVAQYWSDADDLRLNLYRERVGEAPHGFVHLIVKTKAAGDEISFGGTYELIVFETEGSSSEGTETRFDGEVSCGVE